jgi:PBP1b-binding outer membrane lipoprotein LpoB
MKKILNITLIIILAFVLASCFGNETATDGNSSATSQESGIRTETS